MGHVVMRSAYAERMLRSSKGFVHCGSTIRRNTGKEHSDVERLRGGGGGDVPTLTISLIKNIVRARLTVTWCQVEMYMNGACAWRSR